MDLPISQWLTKELNIIELKKETILSHQYQSTKIFLAT